VGWAVARSLVAPRRMSPDDTKVPGIRRGHQPAITAIRLAARVCFQRGSVHINRLGATAFTGQGLRVRRLVAAEGWRGCSQKSAKKSPGKIRWNAAA